MINRNIINSAVKYFKFCCELNNPLYIRPIMYMDTTREENSRPIFIYIKNKNIKNKKKVIV